MLGSDSLPPLIAPQTPSTLRVVGLTIVISPLAKALVAEFTRGGLCVALIEVDCWPVRAVLAEMPSIAPPLFAIDVVAGRRRLRS